MVENRQSNADKAVEQVSFKDTLTPQLLVREYSSAVLGLCLAHAKNFHDSQDLMQQVFLKAVDKFSTLKNKDRARSWLIKIARRTCVDYYRKKKPFVPIPKNLTAKISNDHQIERLHKAIAKLPQDYRETVSLYYLDSQKCSNVAASLKISEVAVRRRLVRARLMLHKILSEDQL